MGIAKLLLRISRLLPSGLSALWDALPPYRHYEGPLSGKEIGAGGKHYIVVERERVAVDQVTFDLLEVGETIRVRYTRAKRAINIDRIVRSPG